MGKKIIIIGAGIAGLSAGCYSQMNGYDTEIFEMQSTCGGLCTTWKRKEFLFDGCIHFLVGSNPKSALHTIWKEVGAIEDNEIINHEFFKQIEGSDGKKLILYSDMDKLEAHLLELSPADAKITKEFTDAIRNYSYEQNAPNISRIQNMDMNDFTDEIQDAFLKEAFLSLGNLSFLLMTMQSHMNNDAGYPLGGSLKFAQRIEENFLHLGGKIHYHSEVDEVLIKEDRAIGIKLTDGTTYTADYVISATDGHITLSKLLKNNYISSEMREFYNNTATCPPALQVSLGINYDLSDQPHDIILKLKQNITISGIERNRIPVRHYCYDKTLCPEGKSIVTSLLYCDYEYWENLSADSKAYREEKDKIAASIIRVIEERFPEISGKVEVSDVATPITFHRYTGAFKGCFMTWIPPKGDSVFSVPYTFPGLKGFYMTGQWVYAVGGLPPALLSARNTIKELCEDNGNEFIIK